MKKLLYKRHLIQKPNLNFYEYLLRMDPKFIHEQTNRGEVLLEEMY